MFFIRFLIHVHPFLPNFEQGKANYQDSKADNLRGAISIKQDGAIATKGFDKNAGNGGEREELHEPQARRIRRDHTREDDHENHQREKDFIELCRLAIIGP